MRHLHQVVLRYSVSLGDLRDGSEPVALDREEHEHAQREVRIDRQSHSGLPPLHG
jgi:hypothetical protein